LLSSLSHLPNVLSNFCSFWVNTHRLNGGVIYEDGILYLIARPIYHENFSNELDAYIKLVCGFIARLVKSSTGISVNLFR
jgi:hypothetical protein